ncbi:glycosyltransferase family 2 protein [Micromonospora endolithica]|uniref:Glycosyltransferase family 2 protein n=1 Tax=Micromonospora endolithica TaxID=230091 RepID=A0A3A9ZL59_9ACTN|nr:glycosyltransferase family 2 protein [Micromonospora endolithica]RKN49090.1 glycosyltransferase family 2 protein [Micromonospora endolithica]TWJ23241.1 GT2 family glycosyltransferase [Micromonospora endolithica]
MTPTPRAVRNDWSAVRVPDLGRWRPRLTVSVVIPAYDCQPGLDLTLAALARQTYPAALLEVVVVDDGTTPPLRLPDRRPPRTRLVRAPEHSTGWGRANALHLGAAISTGEILHWLDADMLVFDEHVEAQARWHHQVPYAVTLGYKRFVDTAPGHPDWPGTDAPAESLFAGHDTVRHEHVEELIDRTDQLRGADHLAFMIHVGATAALRRELYDAAGGLDTGLRLGEDTEFGYRLAQAGALFVPEPAARSWHLGPSHVMRDRERVQRYNRPFLADRMPQPRWLRRDGGTAWSVPLVTVVLPVGAQPLERVRAVVDTILTGDEPDVRVCLVAPWDSLDDARVRPLADPALDLRLLAATYRSEPRVRLVTEAPGSVHPVPFLLELPATVTPAPYAVRRLVEIADRHQVGLVRVPVPAGPGATGPAEVRLWRTAALGRAGWVRTGHETPAEVVTAVHGCRLVSAELAGIADAGAGRPSWWTPDAVEVAGVRSLARATVAVGALVARRAAGRVRRPGRPASGRAAGTADPGREFA